MIGAGSIVLGPVTIGEGARVGAASLVIGDVPPKAVAVGVPARPGLGFSDGDLQELTDNRLPDPVADAFRFLSRKVETLEGRLSEIERWKEVTAEIGESVGEKRKEHRHIFSSFNEEFISGTGI
jgi:serine O-acetyltransferase